MDKVMILGCNGFVGKNMQHYIAKNQWDKQKAFLGVDISTDEQSIIEQKACDVLNKNELQTLLLSEKPDYIINLVGTFYNDDSDVTIRINAGLAKNIFDIITQHELPVKKVLLIGSAAEYGATKEFPITEAFPLRPINMYGLSKVLQSQYAIYYSENHNIPVNVARIFNIIGNGISENLSIGAFLKQINEAQNDGVIYTGNLESQRDFISVDDAIRAIFIMMEKGKPGEIYNVCSGKPIAMQQIVQQMIETSGKQLKHKVDPKRMKKADIPISYGSAEKLYLHTGWKPEHSLKDMIDKLDLLHEKG